MGNSVTKYTHFSRRCHIRSGREGGRKRTAMSSLKTRYRLRAVTEEGERRIALWRERGWLGQAVEAIQPLRSIVIDLEASEEELLARMKEKWRYNVRLAARKGVKIREAETLEDVRAWYRLLQVTG